MGGSLAVKSVETLRGDEPPRLRLISANLACEPYACLADEGPHRRYRAADRQEDVRHRGVPVDAFLSVRYPYDKCRWIQSEEHSWPSPKTSRSAGLPVKDQVLLILYSSTDSILVEDVLAWVEYKRMDQFKQKVLKPLYDKRLI